MRFILAAAAAAVLTVGPVGANLVQDCARALEMAVEGQTPPPELYRQGLNYNFGAWRLDRPGSQNIPLLAHAAQYAADGEPEWWLEYFRRQRDLYQGSEQTSRCYAPIMVAAIAFVYEHSRRLGHHQLHAEARWWLRSWWHLCALCAAPWNQGQKWYDGPTVAIAGMRSGAAHWGQNQVDGQFALAVQWPGYRNARENWPIRIMRKVGGDYALTEGERRLLRDHVRRGGHQDRIARALDLRLLAPMHLLRTEEGIATWVEFNTNGNKGPTYAVVSTPARTEYLHPHPERQQNAPRGAAQRLGDHIVARARGDQWTQRIALPGGEVRYYLVITREGLQPAPAPTTP